MNLEQASKLHNRDEVVLKSNFDGVKRICSICGEGRVLIQNGKKFIIFDLFELDQNGLAKGSLIKNVSHIYLK